jgi:hypothetical protein
MLTRDRRGAARGGCSPNPRGSSSSHRSSRRTDGGRLAGMSQGHKKRTERAKAQSPIGILTKAQLLPKRVQRESLSAFGALHNVMSPFCGTEGKPLSLALAVGPLCRRRGLPWWQTSTHRAVSGFSRGRRPYFVSSVVGTFQGAAGTPFWCSNSMSQHGSSRAGQSLT